MRQRGGARAPTGPASRARACRLPATAFTHAGCRQGCAAVEPSPPLPSSRSKMWALKEAYVKATGEGLGFDLAKVEFRISGGTGG